jgi:hypothetical protein
MVVSSDSLIDERIVQMRKDGSYILTIHNWVRGYDNFNNLDEQVVLCYICNLLDKHNMAISRNEVRKCFNANYNKEFHFDKVGYLNWIYNNFKIRDKTRVHTSQIRKKTPIPQTSRGKSPILTHDLDISGGMSAKIKNRSLGGRK